MAQPQLLLDTCVMLFAARGVKLAAEAEKAIIRASNGGGLFVAAISAWEIAQAVSRGRLALAAPPLQVFRGFVERSGASLCELDAEALAAAWSLPGKVHKDPVDRMFISLARQNGYTLVTGDREILSYGALGHVKTMNCLK